MDRLSKHREEYSTVTRAVPTLCCFWIIACFMLHRQRCADVAVTVGETCGFVFYVQLVLLHIQDMEIYGLIFFRNQKIASLKECRF